MNSREEWALSSACVSTSSILFSVIGVWFCYNSGALNSLYNLMDKISIIAGSAFGGFFVGIIFGVIQSLMISGFYKRELKKIEDAELERLKKLLQEQDGNE